MVGKEGKRKEARNGETGGGGEKREIRLTEHDNRRGRKETQSGDGFRGHVSYHANHRWTAGKSSSRGRLKRSASGRLAGIIFSPHQPQIECRLVLRYTQKSLRSPMHLHLELSEIRGQKDTG